MENNQRKVSFINVSPHVEVRIVNPFCSNKSCLCRQIFGSSQLATMILGISLVVNEVNKGQRMVFRYPETIPACVEKGNNQGLIKLYNQYFSLR